MLALSCGTGGPKAGASSTHSKRFAQFVCGCTAPRPSRRPRCCGAAMRQAEPGNKPGSSVEIATASGDARACSSYSLRILFVFPSYFDGVPLLFRPRVSLRSMEEISAASGDMARPIHVPSLNNWTLSRPVGFHLAARGRDHSSRYCLQSAASPVSWLCGQRVFRGGALAGRLRRGGPPGVGGGFADTVDRAARTVQVKQYRSPYFIG